MMDLFLLFVFFSTYFMILNSIGFRIFTAKDWYKMAFPLHLFIYLRSRRDALHFIIVFIHIASITTWIVKYIL